MLTLALTHHNRFEMLIEAIAPVRDDPRISEIVISDDASDDGSWERLETEFHGNPRVRLHRNAVNVDCYINKANAIARSVGPFVILFDSDNIITPDYLDAIEAVGSLEPRVAYLPTFAEPHFDYRHLAGLMIDRHTVADHMSLPHFSTALNTANYLVHRDEYLRVWNPRAAPHTADSIYQNFRWLDAGNKLYFVPGLRYFHRVHGGSHYLLNNKKTGNFAREIELRLWRMR